MQTRKFFQMQLQAGAVWNNVVKLMKFQIGQHAKTDQQLTLAPRIIQMMEIMQLPLPALEERITQELESNIALELVDTEPGYQEEVEVSNEELQNEFSRIEEFEEQSGAELSDLPPKRILSSDRDPKLDAMANIRARQESLSEQLLHQWSFAEVDEMTKKVGDLLIGLIDVDGFLTVPEAELLSAITAQLEVEISKAELEMAVLSLQKWLEPTGIAARSLHECLMIQVAEYMADDADGWKDVSLVIDEHLDDLVSNRLPKVATSTGIGIERVKLAIEKMHELTVSPARLIASERVLPVIPDAFIEYDDLQEKYVVGIRSGTLPPLTVSTHYESVLSDSVTDKQAKQFIQRNINAARWIIEAVDQRKSTIKKIVQIVAEKQRDFLDQGDAYLRPLPMVEVADMLGVHVATVSRAVADKWVQTPRGIFPLRRFFSGGTGSSKDGDVSWEAIKSRLVEIIDKEDKQKPFSDEVLAKKLREQGIDIARRTVVKYRQQLGLPAARLRKAY